MRNIISTFMIVTLLSLVVSCNNGGQEGNNGASNEQTASNAPARDAKATVDIEKLPQLAKDFINNKLPGKDIVRMKVEEDDVEVWLNSGEKLEFDTDGNIKEIECLSGLSASVVGQRIIDDVKSIKPEAYVVKIDKDSYGEYEVTLDNGMEIKYDPNFKRLGIDD